jgi:hypothetical protein
MTERVQSILRVPFFLCQQCVPEPASQVPLSVVSDISDDINSPEIQGKWGPLRQRGSVPSIFNGGTMGDNHFVFYAEMPFIFTRSVKIIQIERRIKQTRLFFMPKCSLSSRAA